MLRLLALLHLKIHVAVTMSEGEIGMALHHAVGEGVVVVELQLLLYLYNWFENRNQVLIT